MHTPQREACTLVVLQISTTIFIEPQHEPQQDLVYISLQRRRTRFLVPRSNAVPIRC